mgnify:CR=1 FL=1
MGNSRIIQKSFIASLLLFTVLVQPSSAIGFSAKYKNCAQLKAKHRFGVALSLKIAGNYPATISKKIYVENSFLDSDKDGIDKVKSELIVQKIKSIKMNEQVEED